MYVPKWLFRLLLGIGAVSLTWIAKDAVDEFMSRLTEAAAPVSAPSTAEPFPKVAPSGVTLMIIDGDRGERTGRTSAGAGAPISGLPAGRLPYSDVPDGGSRSQTVMGGQTPSVVVVDNATAAFPRARGSSGALGGSIHLTPENATTAIGEHIVIAYDDSIVLVGDNGQLRANTGDAAEGAAVAVDSQSSRFTTTSETTAAFPSFGSGAAAGSAVGALAPVAGTAGSGTFPLGEGPIDIAGYENHSVSATGLRNVVTYDDSNVFIARDGKINSNTGDTDSAGLNAVDTVRSKISAGPHCDDGCDNESIIRARAGMVDEGDSDEGGQGDSGDDSDGEEAEENDSDDRDVSDPVEAAETREQAGSGAGTTRSVSGNGLTIGGDGYDDLGVRVNGNDQVVTYDDSNVVIGGKGDVNAQVGDSDTGGTVTMGTVDSKVSGGNSR